MRPTRTKGSDAYPLAFAALQLLNSTLSQVLRICVSAHEKGRGSQAAAPPRLGTTGELEVELSTQFENTRAVD